MLLQSVTLFLSQCLKTTSVSLGCMSPRKPEVKSPASPTQQKVEAWAAPTKSFQVYGVSLVLPKMKQLLCCLILGRRSYPDKQSLRNGAASRNWGDPVLSMQLSVFYKLESLLCCSQFLNWRLYPLSSGDPCGLRPWTGWES